MLSSALGTVAELSTVVLTLRLAVGEEIKWAGESSIGLLHEQHDRGRS